MKALLSVVFLVLLSGMVWAQVQTEPVALNAAFSQHMLISENSVSVWWAWGNGDTNPTGIAKSFDTGYDWGDLPLAGDWLTAMRLDCPVSFDILLGVSSDGGNGLAGFGFASNWGDQHFRVAAGLAYLTTGNVVPYASFTAHF